MNTRIQFSALVLLLITNVMRAQIGPGSALELLGTNHAVVASNPSLVLTTSLTFEAWVDPEKPGCGSILSRGSGFDGSTDYNFVIGWNGTNCGTQMKLALYAGAWHYSAGVLPVSAWSHVAATYDGTNVSLYINGVLDSTTPQSGSVYQSGSPLYIGRQGQTCNCNTFQGQLDEVRIWNIARSTNDITSDMSFWQSGTESNLVAYYRFEEGKGLVVSNSAATGSANDGTLAGAATWTSSDALFSPDPETGTPKLDINNTAWVSGSVNPGNLATLAYVEWGATTGYGTKTAATNFVGKNQAFSLATVQLTGL